MTQASLKILQVSTFDIAGGAEKIANDLYHGYQIKGHDSFLAVGEKVSKDPDILIIPNDKYKPWKKFWFQVADYLTPHIETKKPEKIIRKFLKYTLAQPKRFINRRLGYEFFDFPGTKDLLRITSKKPDIIHCHNLHRDYFDLRFLPQLSHQIPTVLTLHDAWLLSGHCAHSFDCDRWKTGCGSCPDLTIYPEIKRDGTAYNWEKKQRIYQQSKLYVTTPSQWLMDKVKESILSPAIMESRVIPNGIDLSIFHPVDKQYARRELRIATEEKVVLFIANGIRKNLWKDYKMMRTAVALVSAKLPKERILFIALGEDSPPEQIGNSTIRFIPYIRDPKLVALYYQSADVYIHAARADTFPNTVLEALACGTPVVATDVGGIPEQIEHGKTGFLVSVGDAVTMANFIQILLENQNINQQMSELAVKTVQHRFSLERMIDNYLEWYQEILHESLEA